MPNKDKVESLLKLADFSWRDYSERRSIEWKTNFALWLALGTFAGFMFQHQTVLALGVKLLVTAVLAVTFLVYALLWKAEIMQRNRSDKQLVRYYWSEVNKELNMEPPVPAPQKPRTHLSQVAITFIFVLLATLSVWTTTQAGK
jgi:hypothetical protein